MAGLLGGQPKPLASLSSGLLARKGQARPAMRPQGFGFTSLSHAGDQLGWNDMGHDVGAPEPVEALPPVLVERAALKEEFAVPETEPVAVEAPILPAPACDTPVRTVSVLTAKRLQRETHAKLKGAGKAAFTLRLDADRHLRLRLATATRHRSAQQLVTEALDTFLQTLPEVEALASQLPPAGRRSTGE